MTIITTKWSKPWVVNLAESEAHLSELVSNAESGEETIITRRAQPVVKHRHDEDYS